ncbi:Permease of the drug/metabolite transporter (DMT) superfamily [Streptoalloteichus tenebrarius]|uniref:Permease of the drug/metabolite transporter (DMT) superfamily n=1 Tax=Streptoalloteichus tenebrarius (strain ATCC 17920 / DSM 40477 / JCM 4838 / CBS 697.72 / NBRC 16177 / NCIMB 11028 / NRRL B-12390 / A12253. 1 / ISP 5477) TaxID=1933 RepID=A0ABT1I283_STRSD|nr:EamA family transporter [Streptoalloteichus tenebrarius]MCP2261680.1 Permease of the drug/metabolite transporter (DMT) superfamily [Streptoalloteichus tenebrarius]BFE99132.1 drug/metabolite exporter YedA [Streptoalloteichus tenebrarius]
MTETSNACQGTASLAPRTPTWLVWANLLILYVLWGSTYLAIKVMVRTVPPLLGTGLRCLVAGLLLYAWCALRERRPPTVSRAELAGAATSGALILGVAFGLLGIAEQTVHSGLSSLVVATVPLWTIVLRLLHRQPVPRLALASLAVGFGGAVLLLLPTAGGSVPVFGLALLVAAAVSEAVGLFYTPRLPEPADPLLGAALQMTTAGVLLLLASVVVGEPVDVGAWSGESLMGLLYLIGPGSAVAYVSLVWLLGKVPPSLASTYAYVNPVVAVVLGVAFLSEPVQAVSLLGAGLIISSVALVVRAERKPASSEKASSEG